MYQPLLPAVTGVTDQPVRVPTPAAVAVALVFLMQTAALAVMEVTMMMLEASADLVAEVVAVAVLVTIPPLRLPEERVAVAVDEVRMAVPLLPEVMAWC